MRFGAALACALVALVACGRLDAAGAGDAAAPSASVVEAVATSATSATSAPDATRVAEGRALVEKHQCNRCHEGTGLEAPAKEKHCFRCHVEIADGTFAMAPALVAQWKPRVMRLRFAPSLAGVGAVVKPDWVRGYLRAPFDLRPGLHPTMPLLAMTDADADAIAAYLASLSSSRATAPSQPDAPAGDPTWGRALFASKGCSGCHAFTGAGTDAPPPVRDADRAALALAPDLRFARDRLAPGLVAAWVRDPGAIKPGAAMPAQDVTAAEARDLAAFVLAAPLESAREAPRRARLPVLDRPVGYDEVARRVLRRICWHCHSQPDFARGDGGPGNTGGFGFAARRLDLSSYEAVSAGYLDAAGERSSVFAPGPTGEPALVAALLERAEETAGRDDARVRGMPLGLPALSAEDVQLVETWVAQGHPR